MSDADDESKMARKWSVSKLEALLAECETQLAYAADNLDGILKENDIASLVIRDKCRALVDKLKARMEEGGDA